MHTTAISRPTQRVRLRLAGELLELWPERVILLPEHGLLLAADVHVGKAQAFRALGVPVPAGTTEDTLARLSALVDASGAQELVLLGDFLHSAHVQSSAATLTALQRWRTRHSGLGVRLVRGNHDAHAGDPPAALGIEVVDEPWPVGDALALAHHPRPVAGRYVLAGHLHPCVWLGGRAGDRLRLPCFWFGDETEDEQAVGVLPAFGAFTGMHAVERRAGDRVYAIGADAVRPLV
ncbi:ligase-associated DNA damage response endonuclease PdeM [Rivibacter subsaxonicus]|uniref:Putative phosphoesterase n=1 Tax=Rivibacter subsaxonicus TaxID=457575 RepID=A0A4V2FSN5_9BURK|nr:ligase-associated DNA damage response endonuclease PdeM [Rivibacter subsaxonicus]RZT94995.1 putative phosphoesterase [Rivibacter subsaxonicus]